MFTGYFYGALLAFDIEISMLCVFSCPVNLDL